jgi:hypothetical protein
MENTVIKGRAKTITTIIMGGIGQGIFHAEGLTDIIQEYLENGYAVTYMSPPLWDKTTAKVFITVTFTLAEKEKNNIILGK